MCTAVIRFEPDAEWPLLLAFVRDEDRTRAWDHPEQWWSEHPTLVGGRDERHGGTWLALDVDPGRAQVACILNRLDAAAPALDPDVRLTRGRIPVDVVVRGEFVPDDWELERYDPFNLIHATATGVTFWRWDGATLTGEAIAPGTHIVSSHGIDELEASQRQRDWLPRFEAAAAPDPGAAGSTQDAWDSWTTLLDGRSARVDDPSALVIAGVAQHPTFGTVSASLVAIARDGHVRYDFNPTPDLDPDAWRRVDTSLN